MRLRGYRPLLTLLAGVFAFSAPRVLHAQNGVTVLDSLNARHGGPGASYGFYFASCWGYVAPDGHEYALLGAYGGTSIIDLDARPIREVAFVAGAASEWKEIKTWGRYAYVVSEGPQGVQIIDLGGLPDSVRLVRSLTAAGGRNLTRNHTVTVADGHLYLNGSALTTPGGAIILSLADPENPAYVGEYAPVYFHDVYVRRDTLYGAGLGNGIYIADVRAKNAPVQLARVTYSGSGTHNTWASEDGGTLFTTDEVGSTQKNLKIWDITNLAAVTQLAPFTPNPATVIHNVHGRGGYAYIAHYRSGVYVADVRDRRAVTNAGWYNTYRGGGTSPSYAGAWGVYPYFPSGRWIASDTQTGLYLLRFDGLRPRTRAPLLSPPDGDTLRPAGTRTLRWRRAANPAEDPHFYTVHVRGAGVDTLLRASDSLLALPALPGFRNGSTYRWSLRIRDEFTEVAGRDTFRFVWNGAPTGVRDDVARPAWMELNQNYPNPFNPATTISFELAADRHVRLEVVNTLGQLVAVPVDAPLQAGRHAVRFDARLGGGAPLPSGVYFCRLRGEDGTVRTRTMMLLR